MAEFLSICMPTRNRAEFFRAVLSAFEQQIKTANLSPEVVRIYVSDNTSTDETPEICKEFAARLPHLSYSRNPENIGGDRNILKCAGLGSGQYRWVVGDDDIINPGALEYVLGVLRREKPALMIIFDSNYAARMERPKHFPSFRDYAAECARSNPHALAEHTLITSNIFRADAFDHDLARANLLTRFGHMYGLAGGVIRKSGSVYLSEFPVMTVRQRRAAAVDGDWPHDLDAKWFDYLNWLKQEMNLPELRPEAVFERVRADLWKRIRRNPFKYVWNNLPALVQPQAYLWFLRRVLFLRKVGDKKK